MSNLRDAPFPWLRVAGITSGDTAGTAQRANVILDYDVALALDDLVGDRLDPNKKVLVIPRGAQINFAKHTAHIPSKWPLVITSYLLPAVATAMEPLAFCINDVAERHPRQGAGVGARCRDGVARRARPATRLQDEMNTTLRGLPSTTAASREWTSCCVMSRRR